MKKFKKGDIFKIKSYLGNTGIYYISKVHRDKTYDLKNYFTEDNYAIVTEKELENDFIKVR